MKLPSVEVEMAESWSILSKIVLEEFESRGAKNYLGFLKKEKKGHAQMYHKAMVLKSKGRWRFPKNWGVSSCKCYGIQISIYLLLAHLAVKREL